ncbi:MAG TPA: aldehyde ferredoxin oxidoreductase family protein [Firmicutes bacterium]|jgi:aldehyde:ferredoxin oxidoreductase|nr:aldehyde ferredoxin oxidoreductase family protein [Bacillota bacterium]
MERGFYGKVLEVDLSSGRLIEMVLPPGDYRRYLGGSGLAAKIFYERGYHRIEPLDEAAPLLIFTGILTGHRLPAACKAVFCGRSPATGIWAEATVGGYWPAALKCCRYDGLIITGRARKPVYLYLSSEGAVIRDAAALWGKDVYATEALIREEMGETVRSAAIGPAGERGALIAAIMIDGSDTRAAGRCGLGAIMGAKNLKAVAARREGGPPPVADPGAVTAGRREALPRIREKAKGLTDFGTAGGVPAVEKTGDLPIRNWTGGSWAEGAARVSGQAMAAAGLRVKHYACFSCPIRCGKDMKVETGPYRGTVSHGPEYETIAGFGSLCLNDDPNYIIAANDLCNRLGLDTISTAAAIAFAMELSEKGLIGEAESGGLDLRWGSGEAILALIPMIARRDGLGKQLSLGVKRAAAHFGPVAREFIAESKGLEMAYHDPRAFTSMALVYATGNRGACHLEGLTFFNENGTYPASLVGLPDGYEPHGSEGKAALAKRMQDFMGLFNALGLCKFLIRGHVTMVEMARWSAAVTGWDLNEAELWETGERLFNLKRLINVALGISRKDDTLSPRLLVHDRREGGAAGSLPHLGKMLSEYYDLRGWSAEGIPLPGTLSRLNLSRGE